MCRRAAYPLVLLLTLNNVDPSEWNSSPPCTLYFPDLPSNFVPCKGPARLVLFRSDPGVACMGGLGGPCLR